MPLILELGLFLVISLQRPISLHSRILGLIPGSVVGEDESPGDLLLWSLARIDIEIHVSLLAREKLLVRASLRSPDVVVGLSGVEVFSLGNRFEIVLMFHYTI